jgi:zinc transport system ATP-binding protein
VSLIELSNVSYHSSTTHEKLIDSVSFTIDEKTITTIIGPNGAGKSTLLRLILGLIGPSSGKISRSKKIKIGYMPQRLSLNSNLPITVERFLSLSKPEIVEKRIQIEAVLKQVKADYTLKQSIHSLSGGEWQRILLARALLQSPDLLVLDEPVQGLDLAGQAEFYRTLHHIKHTLECAVVHVSHDLNLVWDASDTVICLNKHICCMGHPDVVRQNQDVQRLFGGFSPYTHHHDHCHDGVDHSTCEHSHV